MAVFDAVYAVLVQFRGERDCAEVGHKVRGSLRTKSEDETETLHVVKMLVRHMNTYIGCPVSNTRTYIVSDIAIFVLKMDVKLQLTN